MTTVSARDLYGWACIEPRGSAVAGTSGTLTLTYHVGRYGIDDGGTLKIAVRFASDWGYPQSEDPAALNYYTVSTTGAGSIQHRFDLKGYIRPFQKCLVIDVAEWALREGDTITVVYGDRSQGSPGTVLQTFREYRFEFKVAVDSFGTGQFVELPEFPALEIIPAAAAKLVVIGPTQVQRGERFSVGIKLEDEWGNPAVGYRGTVALDGTDFEGLPETSSFTPEEEGVQRFEGVSCPRIGTFTIRAADAGGSPRGESHPIRCVERATEYRPFWGDLHGQSSETVGTNSVEDYFRFARDTALLDFAGHQGNDFQITPEFWRRIGRCAREFYEPGRFVVFPGYEWSATTPAGGDRNVYYLHDGEEIFRTSHWQVEAKEEETANDRYPAGELFDELRGREALIVPHIGGRPCNLEFHDPELEPVIEIYSAWGQFEWLLRESIERGYKVGFVCGSDDHKGRPGASYPGSSSFGVYGGLTCVLARELTREGVWEALKARRCYGTTGQRIILDVRGDGHLMGEEYEIEAPTISVEAAATADIEEVLVMRGLDRLYRHPREMPRDGRRVRVVWSGARIKGRDRIARWDGHLTVVGAHIDRAEGYAFDSAAEGITEQTGERVAWKSVTSGDEDGVVLTLDGGDGKLSFQSEIVSFRMSLGQLSEGPYVKTAGGVDLQVKVEHLPLGLQSRQCRFEFTDTDAPPGCHPYYVRLTQVDGSRAWSSPLYVQVKGTA